MDYPLRLLGALLFNLVCLLGSILITTSIAIVSPFSKELVRRGSNIWARWFVWCSRVFLGIRLVVRGRVPQEGVIVASKHTSAYETILTLYLFHHPAVVMKAELRSIPIWGFVAAQHGSIFVERGKAGAALKSMLRQSKARAAEGRPVFIFPEGTRVPVGTAPPLKAGLYGVYGGLHVPIVPVAHNAGEVWTRSFVKRRGTVTVSFLPEIPADLPREAMEAAVHAAINQDPLTAEVLA
jgi:1-acyl-sn-glycerol-3-phosphate acyltransferase